jgi:hypothetical protein
MVTITFGVGCRVNAFGELGRVGGHDLYYVLYRKVRWDAGDDTTWWGRIAPDHPFNNTALAMFSAPADSQRASVLWYEDSGDLSVVFYERPTLFFTPVGQIIMVPYRWSGTGSYNEDRYLRWVEGHWILLDTESWWNDLRLPEDHSVRKGVVLDLQKLRAELPLYRESDGNCCPTGGLMVVEFELRDDRLELASARHVLQPIGS